MPIEMPEDKELSENLTRAFVDSVNSRSAAYSFLANDNVLRPPLCRARLGIRWDPETFAKPDGGCDFHALGKALATLHLEKAKKFLLETGTQEWGETVRRWFLLALRKIAEANDPVWSNGAYGAVRMPTPATIDLPIEVQENRWRAVTEYFVRHYSGDVELDKSAVLEALLNDDEGAVEDLIREAIDESYCELSEEDDDPYDSDIGDDDEGDDGWEFARGDGYSGLIDTLRTMLADELAAAQAERDAEEEEDDERH